MRHLPARWALFTTESAFHIGATSQTTMERHGGLYTVLNVKVHESETKPNTDPDLKTQAK